MQLFALVLILLAAVLPPVSPKRPKTSRLSRGAVWTGFESLQLDQRQVDHAKQEMAALQRIAVVASGSADSQEVGGILALLLGQKLSYGAQTLPLDFVSAAQLFEKCTGVDEAIAIARESNINTLVWCEARDQDLIITCVPTDASEMRKTVATIAIDESWLNAVPATRDRLYSALGVDVPEEKVQQLPSASAMALAKWFEAYLAAARIISAENELDQQALCQQAVELCDQALTLDPGLIEAYVLKASCLDELGDVGGVKQTLRDGYSRRDPQRIDQLTSFEIEADYARFVKSDIDGAFAGYQQIMESDPHNLRGAWGLIDILLTGDGISKPGKEDLAEAAKLATMILTAHPQSAVAAVIADQVK